ncbi:MAG: hypothetical protein DRN26_02415 [Thermoplasmata archaeon]|nr:MAG: hypothetical protein DRN26_02415 [Thermoplasmata archaeon]
MKVTIGEEGCQHTWQKYFPEETSCVHCDGKAHIGFVAHEGAGEPSYVCNLHKNDPNGEGYWLHDACAVAVYFCRKCLKPTALYNQA